MVLSTTPFLVFMASYIICAALLLLHLPGLPSDPSHAKYVFLLKDMTTKVTDIIRIMETIAPVSLSEEWDNSGLQVGKKDWKVRNIWVSLDPSVEVVSQACKENVDLLITHHPLIFSPLNTIDFETPVGSVVYLAAQHKMAIFSAHTNLDSVSGGLNDVLSKKIGLSKPKVLRMIQNTQDGLGRVGELEEAIPVETLVKRIKKSLGIKSIKVAGKIASDVRKVAVCSGSGSSLMRDFFSSNAQVYISGDLRYHDARAAEEAGRVLIDIGHFESEHLIVNVLANQLRENISKEGFKVSVNAYNSENDPFTII